MNWEIVVAALRDTADKAQKQTELIRDNYAIYGKTETYNENTYSRDWIIGRIEGIADTLESMNTLVAKKGK